MFSVIYARINGWVNNGEAGDLRRHRAHYNVVVMVLFWTSDDLVYIYVSLGLDEWRNPVFNEQFSKFAAHCMSMLPLLNKLWKKLHSRRKISITNCLFADRCKSSLYKIVFILSLKMKVTLKKNIWIVFLKKPNLCIWRFSQSWYDYNCLGLLCRYSYRLPSVLNHASSTRMNTMYQQSPIYINNNNFGRSNCPIFHLDKTPEGIDGHILYRFYPLCINKWQPSWVRFNKDFVWTVWEFRL